MRELARAASRSFPALSRLALLCGLLFAFAAFSRPHQTTTTCTSDKQCARLGELCCNEFAFPGSPKICKPPVGGHCPLIP